MTEDREQKRDKHDHALREWIELQRKVLPLETAIDQVRARLHGARADERDTLEFALFTLLVEADREAEALQVFGAAIAQRPNEVLAPDDGWLDCHGSGAEEHLRLIDFALAHAGTGAWVRFLLGEKAWDLVFLRRGEELGQVLGQIMGHAVRHDVPDVGRERYFVDASPPGLIAPDIRNRYDLFCPRRFGDVPFKPPEFERPEWAPNGDEIPATHPRADAIDRSEAGEAGASLPRIKTTLSAAEIDRIIFSRLQKHGNWRKTAAVIGWVAQQCEDQERAIAAYEIFERILHLVTDGVLEAQGNLSQWRYSEVRLVTINSAQ